MKGKSESEVAQSCPTLSDPMDCSLPGSSIHGIFQARVLEWVPLPSPSLGLKNQGEVTFGWWHCHGRGTGPKDSGHNQMNATIGKILFRKVCEDGITVFFYSWISCQGLLLVKSEQEGERSREAQRMDLTGTQKMNNTLKCCEDRVAAIACRYWLHPG